MSQDNNNNKVNFELSGNLTSRTKFIVSDGNCGDIDFLEDFELIIIKKGNMQDLCTEANRLMKEHRKKGNLRIIIMGGNSSINPTVLEGAPIECLKRERESLVADLCDKVVKPLETLMKLTANNGDKLAVCSLIPRLANFRVKCDQQSRILSEAYVKCNDMIKDLNIQFGLPKVHINSELEVKPDKAMVFISGQRVVKTHLYNPDGVTISLLAQRKVHKVIKRVLKDWLLS